MTRRHVVFLTERWPLGGARWSEGDEEAVVSRTVAGAMARTYDVDVITPQGDDPRDVADGAFTVHLLGNAPSPVDTLRRNLIIEAISSPVDHPSAGDRDVFDGARAWLEAGRPWRGARAVLAALEPELIVVSGHRHVGLDEALAGFEVPLVHLPLATGRDGVGMSIFEPSREPAITLTVSDAECEAMASRLGLGRRQVHNVDLVVPVNPSVLAEPSTALADQPYVLVLCPAEEQAPSRLVEQARLLALYLTDHPVAVVFRDGLTIWRRGVAERQPGTTRLMDLWRLMAWAHCTVDLRPGRVLALRTLESLRYGTPVVVPDGGRAQQHASAGNGGLWYRDGAELLGCVDAVLDRKTGPRLGAQGRTYADRHYGSGDAFTERVHRALDLVTTTTSGR